MHLSLNVAVEEDTWEALENKLEQSVSVYIKTLQNLYELPSHLNANLKVKLSNNCIEACFDDGDDLTEKDVRGDFNNTLYKHRHKSAAKLKDLIKNKQEEL